MSNPNPYTIIITGGIVSGIGKGITAASIGRLLINRGFTVRPVKADPYLNRDAGTMNPFQHGEVFVTDDGAETDLDLGHYERFLNQNLTRNANFTSGLVYHSVMELEREGEYLGKTIQVIPHVTNEIKRRVALGAEDAPDFLTVEIGGTVGDIEALPFLEAMRQYRDENRTRTAVIQVVKIDYLYPSGESKTKPIQHAVTNLRSYGLQPDLLVVRSKQLPEDGELEKLALFCGVPVERIIPAPDVDSLYDIPGAMEKAGITEQLLKLFALPDPGAKGTAHEAWSTIATKEDAQQGEIRVGLVGKYTHHSDAYLSVLEAISHAGLAAGVHTKVIPIDSESPDLLDQVSTVDAVIVPGGFGSRGIEGKLAAIKYVREKGVPFLGICLGLQLAVIEYARSVAGLTEATSLEFDETAKLPIITFIPGQEAIRRKGGTMRLGSYPAQLTAGSLAEKIYEKYRPTEISDGLIAERHRHRYELNPEHVEQLEKAGLVISGKLPEIGLVEFIELPPEVHPYFIATQAHPEFRSRPELAHPLFAGLIEAAKHFITK